MIHPQNNTSIFGRYAPVLLSFAVAMVLSLVVVPDYIAVIRPDFAAIVLIFWCLNHPGRVGMFTAFVVGLLLDAMYFGMLGQHALAKITIAYILLRFVVQSEYWRNPFSQSLLVASLLLLNSAIIALISRLAHGSIETHTIWLTPLVGAVLWYLFAFVRQTRAPRRYGVSK